MDSVLRDLRYAIRTLRASRLFTLMVVLSLGLAIGATTAVFSFVDAVLLRPLPYLEANRLVLLWASKNKLMTRGISGPDLADLRTQNQVFEGVVPFVASDMPVEFGVENSQRVNVFYVGAGFFQLLGVRPYLGRTFRSDEEQAGAQKVAVLSYSFWKNQLGGNRAAIGQPIILNGKPYTVIGVMRPEFFFPDQTVHIWLPIEPSMIPPDRRALSVHAIARLKPLVTKERAQNEVDTIVHRLASTYPDTDNNLNIGLFPVINEIVGNYRAAFWSLFGGVALLLLIACANIAHLLLARGMRRGPEISIRVTLGATRGAILRQLLTESLLLSTAGGVAGIFIAFWAVHILLRLGLTDIPRFAEAGIDIQMLLFTFCVSLLTGVLFGLLPALRVSNPNMGESLKQGGTAYSYGARSNARDLLMVSEITFAFVLITGAGLLINSFLRLERVHWGFRPDHVLIADVMLPRNFMSDINQNISFADEVIPRLKSLPGVQSVSIARGSPITEYAGGANGVTIGGTHVVYPRLDVVGPGYFQTLGIPIFRGRGFAEADNAQAPKVAVIDKSLAERLWPGQSPLGKRLFILAIKPSIWASTRTLYDSGKYGEEKRLLHDPNSYQQIPYEVVGEVGPVLTYGPLQHDRSAIYVDYRQRPVDIPMIVESFFMRSSAEPSALAKSVRDIIRAINSNFTILSVDTLQQRINGAIGGRGSNKLLLIVGSVTSALGLLLAALGIYGVMAYAVSLRTHEIGVRLALGAQRGSIFLMVLRRAFEVTIAGLLFGVIGAMASTKVLWSYLFGVTPRDPATFVATAILFLLVAFVACYWPARRAMRVEPMRALRYE